MPCEIKRCQKCGKRMLVSTATKDINGMKIPVRTPPFICSRKSCREEM